MSICSAAGIAPVRYHDQVRNALYYGAYLKRKHIFHHPVGIFPSAARWYLAGLATVGLLCVAMQLSVQAHAQQQADELVHAWGKRARVEIGKVRYHLLRNGLILHGIHIERGSDNVDIAQILLRANPKLLTGSSPRIDMVDISGLRAEITHAGETGKWQQDHYLGQIWQATTTLNLHRGNIKLYMKDKEAPPLRLTDVSLHQRLHASIRTMTGSARTQLGRWNLNWFQNTTTRNRADNRQAAWSSKGSLRWHTVDLKKMLAALQLKIIPGHLNGSLTWETMAVANAHKQYLSMHGQMQLQTGTTTEASNPHHVQFSAKATGGRWQVDMDAAAWPLDPWSDALPKIGKRQLISAQLDGKMHWQGQPGHWSVRSDSGLLQDVIYARQDSLKQAAWYWSRIRYNHALLDMNKHLLQLTRIDMLDSRLVMQIQRHKRVGQPLAELSLVEKSVTGQRDSQTASQQDLLEETGWNINADRVDIHNMMLALAMPKGQLTLTALDGQIRCPEGKPLHFQLHTADGHMASGDAAHDATIPAWQIRGKAEKNSRGTLTSTRLTVTGKHIPVGRLRPLLPLQDDEDRPVKLTGVTDLKITATAHGDVWQMQGHTTVQDLMLAHDGNSWRADRVQIYFGPVGPGVDAQHIDSIKSQGWHYITALHPLPSRMNGDVSLDEPRMPAWWMTTLRNNNITIDDLALENGTISVGQSRSVWANRVQITAGNIKAGQWADLAIRGAVTGDGDFYLNGQWQALSDEQRFRGDAGVDQATPFFLNNWMQASGMPRLIRGRLSASLHVGDGQQVGSYQGAVKVQLLQALTEAGTFTSDPLLSRIGYTTPELLQRLEKTDGVITLQYDLNGNWLTRPLNPVRLGLSLQQAMHQAALGGKWHKQTGKSQADTGKADTGLAIQARIRLHGRERLSQNERNRLLKVVRLLRRHPEIIIDLRARWTGKDISESMLQRIRFTQKLIEDYMTYRKIDKRRIFPLWPSAADQANEAGSVQVESRITG